MGFGFQACNESEYIVYHTTLSGVQMQLEMAESFCYQTAAW